MLNVTEVINAFGGYKEAQRRLGVSRALLAEWEVQGIPPKRWEHLAEVAGLIGRADLTVDVIRGAAPTKSSRSTAPPDAQAAE
jgi:hypothetical protein